MGNTQVVLRSAARFSRLRHGWSWAVPVLVVTMLMTSVFVVAVRTERTPADAKQYRFGTHDTVVYLNDLAPSTDGGAGLDAELKAMSRKGFEVGCYSLGANLAVPGSAAAVVGFQESSAGCPPSDWGYELVDGRWPAAVGEGVATTASGFGTGSVEGGLTPIPVTVVGHVESRHALSARILFAAPGTWASWGWPEVGTRFPRLTATASVFLDTDQPDALRDWYAERAAAEPAAGDVLILDAASQSAAKTLLAQFPFVYPATGPIAVLLAVLVTFAFRRRMMTARVRQLVQVGMSRADAVSATGLAFVCGVAVMASLGVALGWIGGATFGGTIAEWISGHVAAPPPGPWDPIVRLGSAVLLGILVAGVATFLESDPATKPGAARLEAPAARRSRHLSEAAGLVLAGAGLWSVLTIKQFGGIYLAILLGTVAVACWSRTIAQAASRVLPESRPATRLARRRLGRRAGAAAIMFAVGALTTGPVVATMILAATQVETENAGERLPPAEDQALYYASGSAATDEKVLATALDVAGPDGVAIDLYYPQTATGEGVVASQAGLGAVGLVKSVQDVASVLRAEVSPDAARVLESGGVAFLRPGDQAASVWTVGSRPTTEIRLPAAVHIEGDSRWERQMPAVMLTGAAKSHGWSLGERQVIITGMSVDEAKALPGVLTEKGFDSSLVRVFDPIDPYTISPLMYGLMGAVAALGVVILVGASRASLHSLRSQSHGLLALGVPRAWQGSVFGMETATAYVPGVLVGLGVSVTVAAVGVSTMGFSPVVPVLAPAVYLLASVGAVVATVVAGMYRLRATSTD